MFSLGCGSYLRMLDLSTSDTLIKEARDIEKNAEEEKGLVENRH